MVTTAVISRKWNSPSISYSVTEEGIAIEMSLFDFLSSVAKEIGNPTLLLTSKQLETAIQKAARAVIAEMKEHSAKVV